MSFDPHADRIIWWGRTRAGRRWFWAAHSCLEEGRELHGWTDTEQEALAAGKAAIDQIAGDAVQVSVRRLDRIASNKLKEVNRAKRAARPAPKTKGSAFVEYLYTTSYGEWDEYYVRYPIIKRTAKRIYFLGRSELLNDDGSFNYDRRYGDDRDEDAYFIDRKKVETNVGVWHRSLNKNLYMTFEASLSWQFKDKREQAAKTKQAEAELLVLHKAMVAAHPDKGGTHEAFILARATYEKARDNVGMQRAQQFDMQPP